MVVMEVFDAWLAQKHPEVILSIMQKLWVAAQEEGRGWIWRGRRQGRTFVMKLYLEYVEDTERGWVPTVVEASTPGTLNREQWNALKAEIIGSESGDPHPSVTMSEGHVNVRCYDGFSDVDIFGSERATDIHIGSVQLIASRNRLVLLSHSGAFPVLRWTVLYDGPIT